MRVSTSREPDDAAAGGGDPDRSTERPATAAGCPGADTMLGFVDGSLRGDARARTEEHAATCGACRAVLSDLARAQSGERRVVSGTGETALAPTELDEPKPTSRPSLPALPGDMIAGKYQVESVLGAGGMGYVLAARHVSLRRSVAIKLLLPEIAQRSDVTVRFLREARAAAKLESEHVVRVLDVDVLPSGAPFIVMEHLEGSDLATHLAKRGKLSVEEAARVVVEACEALAEAHKKGLIHRDLKPANIFLAEKGDGRLVTKILDFGVAKSLGGDSAHGATGASDKGPVVLGTPRYMSPEQARAGNVDARTDVWALGAVLYELVSGKPVWEGATVMELLAKIATETPPSLSVKGVPPALAKVVAKCLQKDPDARFADVAALAAAVAPFAPEETRLVAARLAPRASIAPPPPSRARLGALVVGAVVIGGALAAWASSRGTSSPAGAKVAEAAGSIQAEPPPTQAAPPIAASAGSANSAQATTVQAPPAQTASAQTASGPAVTAQSTASKPARAKPREAPVEPQPIATVAPVAPEPPKDPHGLSDRR